MRRKDILTLTQATAILLGGMLIDSTRVLLVGLPSVSAAIHGAIGGIAGILGSMGLG